MSSSPRSTDLSTKPRRRYAPRMAPEQRREQLIDAALDVILERGYGGVSIEAIAREAGITRPVVYDHFPNLNRLLHAVIEREERIALDQLAEVVPENPGEHEPGELLASGVKRARVLARIEALVRWALERADPPHDLDVELTARAVRDWSEQAGRVVLTDPESYPRDRYEHFVGQFLKLLAPA